MNKIGNENSVYIDRGNGMYLSCLCGKHKKSSKCEVYLRNHGYWTKKVEDMRNADMLEFLKKNNFPQLAKILKDLE